jgi:hypothetical protein
MILPGTSETAGQRASKTELGTNIGEDA